MARSLPTMSAKRRACFWQVSIRPSMSIADGWCRLVERQTPGHAIDQDKALPWVEQRSGLRACREPEAAIRLALMSKVLVITAQPGHRKTTIVESILRVLSAKGAKRFCCGPTAAPPSV